MKITNRHNHSLTSAAVTSFFKPTLDVEQIFLEMFENGAGPSDALSSYRNHMSTQMEDAVEYLNCRADRSKMPDYDWVRHFYHSIFEAKYGSTKSADAIENLKNFIEKINVNYNEPVCKFSQVDDSQDFVVAIVTPIMQRILCTPLAGELMFVDSSGSVDKFGLRVFLLMTKLRAGGVPIGVLITTHETTCVIEAGLHLFLTFCNEESFGGRGTQGPMSILTDDSTSEIAALENVFPNARLFLCIFHVLQFVYRWLCNSESGVTAAGRNSVYHEVRKMVYAESFEKLEYIYNELLRNCKNGHVANYLKKLYNRREKWALVFRKNTLMRGSNTNNIVERGMRVLKENVLKRIKAQSPSQLVDFLINDYSEFYKEKLLSSALHGTCNKTTNKRKNGASISNYKFEDTDSESLVIVINLKKKTRYLINMDIGVCSCYVGLNGAYCKHQEFLHEQKNTFSHPLSVHTLPEEAKLELYRIATGLNTAPHGDFFKPLVQANDEPSVEVPDEPSDENMSFLDNLNSTADEVNASENTEDAESNETREEEEEENDEVSGRTFEEFKSNWNAIFDIIAQDPTTYVKGLESMNKHLKTMKHMPSTILPSLFSYNRNAGFLAKKRMRSTRRIGVNSAAIARRKPSKLAICSGLKDRRKRVSAVKGDHAAYTSERGRSARVPHSLQYRVENN